jgi:hypothetical protein
MCLITVCKVLDVVGWLMFLEQNILFGVYSLNFPQRKLHFQIVTALIKYHTEDKKMQENYLQNVVLALRSK